MQNSYHGYNGPVTLHGLGDVPYALPISLGVRFDTPSCLYEYCASRGWFGQTSFVFDESVECLVLRSFPFDGRTRPIRMDIDLIVRDADGLRIPVFHVNQMFEEAKREAHERRMAAWVVRYHEQPPFRSGPVPFTGQRVRRRFKHARSWPKMFQEVAASDFLDYDEDCADLRISARFTRTKAAMAIPAWDDWGRDSRSRNWKSARRTQWKEQAR